MDSGRHSTAAELQVQIQQKLVEELSSKDRQFRDLVLLLEEVVFRCDIRGRLTFVNPSWEAKLGYPVQDTVGRRLHDFCADQETLNRLRSFGRVNSSVRDAELMLRASDQSVRNFVLRAQRDDAGWVGSLFDITERCRVEAALRAREREARSLSAVASRTDNLVVIADSEGCIEWVNDAFTRTAGFRLEEVRGRRPGDFLQGAETDPATVAIMRKALSDQTGFNVEVVNYTAEGRPFWVAVDCCPVHAPTGELTHFIAIQKEITARKLSEQALRDSERRHRQIVDSVRDVIFRCDVQMRLEFLNTAWTSLTGMSSERSLGQSLWSLVHPDDHTTLLRSKIKLAEGKAEFMRQELRLRRGDGCWRWCEMLLSRDSLADGTELSFTGTLSDVQERREAQEAMRHAKEEAERLSAERTRFVANMSHEIRTPLNAVIGMGELLNETRLSEEQAQYTSTIVGAGKALLALVNDVLDFAKLEAGQLIFERRPINLLDAFEQAVDIVEPRLLEKGLSLHLEVDPDLPRRVHGDELRFQQVLVNLLGNAVKFTDHGGIELKVERVAAGESGTQDNIRIQVIDSGIGIEAGEAERLFDDFSQADASTTRTHGGTGLGLAICRQICEQAGGRIWAEAGSQGGTVFTVEAALRPLDDAVLAPLAGERVRVAASNPDLARKIEKAVQWSGASVVDTDERWLLSDDAAAVGPELDLGHALHLPDSLKQVLTPQRLMRMWHRSEDLSPDREGRTPVLGHLRVLVAEDNVANQLLMRRALSRLGYTATVVGNGQEALDVLEREDFDLLLLDMHMPRMDGISTVRALRARADLPQPRVVAVTADATSDARVRALRSGCDAWVTKPITPHQIRCLVEEAEAELGPMDVGAWQGRFEDRPSMRCELALAALAAFEAGLRQSEAGKADWPSLFALAEGLDSAVLRSALDRLATGAPPRLLAAVLERMRSQIAHCNHNAGGSTAGKPAHVTAAIPKSGTAVAAA